MTDNEIMKLLKLLSDEFKIMRKERKLTLEDVAFDLNVSSTYIGKIENGNLKKLSLFMYIKLANYYDIDIKEVIGKAEYKYDIYTRFFDY